MPYIHKSFGANRSEQFLAKLCEKSFLNLWSYPNLFYSKGKELCDVLVVCDKHVLIISDKQCEYKDTGDLTIDWKRWWKKTIHHARSQILAAEKNIFIHKRRLYLDPKCKHEFPLSIPTDGSVDIHRIIIAKGANNKCQEHFNEKTSKTFILNNKPQSINNEQLLEPFTIGDINAGGQYIHVLDEQSFQMAFSEFDTLTDFTLYLSKREKLFRTKAYVIAYGEDCLIGRYLKRMCQGEHDFFSDEEQQQLAGLTGLHLDGDEYSDMLTHPQYVAKKKEDKISYLWDSLITKFTDNIISGEILSKEGNESVDELEESIRIMALESRLSRRFLAQSIADASVHRGQHSRFARIIPPGDSIFSKSPYIFVFVDQPDNVNELHVHREYRKALMLGYADSFIDKHFPASKKVLVLGLDYQNSKHGIYSEDALLLEVETWSDEDSERAKHNATLLNIFNDDNMQYRRFRGDEYPDIQNIKQKHKRNKKAKLKKQLRKEANKTKRRRR